MKSIKSKRKAICFYFLPGMGPEAPVREHEHTARPSPGMRDGVAQAPLGIEDRAPIRPAKGLQAGPVAEADPTVRHLRAVAEGEWVELVLLSLVEDRGQAASLGLTGSLCLEHTDTVLYRQKYKNINRSFSNSFS